MAPVENQGEWRDVNIQAFAMHSPATSSVHPGLRAPWLWLTRDFPRTFRRNSPLFFVALAAMGAGVMVGGGTRAFYPDSKDIVIPFTHLLDDPTERVATVEIGSQERLHGGSTGFWRFLISNNIRVSILTLALGLTWGVGTVMLLFYNGVILGAVIVDYLAAGETLFLLGWLMPHGAIEIPAVLISGQAGLLLGSSLIGWGDRTSLTKRLRLIGRDLALLIAGVALLLVWAGLVEAFLSERHASMLSYSLKIVFGLVELAALALFLTFSGRRRSLIATSS
jgi:uncharacterized membrane protein SpoIIM required for sporulation